MSNLTTLNPQEAARISQQRALAQWAEYEVRETPTPGVFLVSRNGASYRVTEHSCSCPHHQHRGVDCKHMARVKARLARKNHWAVDEAAARAARAKADREALWG